MNLRSLAAVCLACLCPATPALAETVSGLQGGSYVINTNGNQISSLVNDDGSVVTYQYDAEGNEHGLSVYADGVTLDLQYSTNEDFNGWVQEAIHRPI
jgi:hypothetical protein